MATLSVEPGRRNADKSSRGPAMVLTREDDAVLRASSNGKKPGRPSAGSEENTAMKRARKAGATTDTLAGRRSSGVVYLQRIPPGLDVGIVRSILGRCGKIGRVWLRPENAADVAERRSLGGRRRAGFMDGWVEFKRAADAQAAVEMLHGQPIVGATRRGKFQHDLWCMKALPDYAWSDLVEEVCGTKRERVLRVKREIAAAKRERAYVERKAELARSLMRAERSKDEQPDEAPTLEPDSRERDDDDGGRPHAQGARARRVIRRFRQKRALDGSREDGRGLGEPAGDEAAETAGLKRLEAMDAASEAAPSASAVNADLVGRLFKRRRVS